MTEQDRLTVERLLSQIEIATGELPERDGIHASIIARILQATNGLRSVLSVVRTH